MKVSLAQVRQAENILRKLAAESLPAIVAFQVSRVLKAANELLGESREIERKLFEKYGKQSGPDSITILPENEEAFRKEITELFSVEEELVCKPLALNTLETVKITPAELIALEPFLIMD